MRRLIIAIPEADADRLAELAQAEFREPRAQASVLLVEAIRRAGETDLRSRKSSARAEARQ